MKDDKRCRSYILKNLFYVLILAFVVSVVIWESLIMDPPKLIKSETYTVDSVTQPIFFKETSIDGLELYFDDVISEKDELSKNENIRGIGYESLFSKSVSLSEFSLLTVFERFLNIQENSLVLYNTNNRTYTSYEVSSVTHKDNKDSLLRKYKKYKYPPKLELSSVKTLNVSYFEGDYVAIEFVETWSIDNEKEVMELLKNAPKRKEK